MRRWRRVILLAALAAGAVGVWLWLGAPARRHARAEAMLRVDLPELSFQNVNLEEAVETLRGASGAELVLDPRLREENIINQPVDMRLGNVTLAQALAALTGYVNSAGWNIELESAVRDGVIVLTSSDGTSGHAYLRIYDIADISIELPEAVTICTLAGRPGDSGGGLFVDQGDPPPRTRREYERELASLIKDACSPTEWYDNGGTGAVMAAVPAGSWSWPTARPTPRSTTC